MSLILTVTDSETQLVFGIPQYVTVSANQAANIYYTFDGSTPSSDSFLAEEKIFLPSDQPSFVFKCVAIYNSEESAVFSKEYTADNASVRNTRKGNEAGIIANEIGKTVKYSFGYDYLGAESGSITLNRDSVDFVTSETSAYGDKIDGDSSKDFINFAKKNLRADKDLISTPNNNVNFNPRAKVINIDGRTQEKMAEQSVMLINRPYDSFTYEASYYTENETKYRSLITGNLVRYIYDNATGETTFYYYDSLDSRWIISKQKTSPKGFNFGNYTLGRAKHVYKWINDPVMTKLI